MLPKLRIITIVLASVVAFNNAWSLEKPEAPLTDAELKSVKENLFHNITTNRQVFVKKDGEYTIYSIPGAVLASPSARSADFSQDYQYHWMRDAALTMQEVTRLYKQTTSTAQKKILKQYFINYINFERKAQTQISKPGEKTLGQPKFNIDGMIWEGPWARPQNDGAALRAVALIEIAKIFKQENENIDQLISMINTDLNYVVAEWHNPSFDLWEEVNDRDHFFTKMVQRKALLDGAAFLKEAGHYEKSDSYLNAGNQITTSLHQHWNNNLNYYTETLYQLNTYGGGLDTSVLLGVLYGDLDDPQDPFAVNNEHILRSVYAIRNAFNGAYKINSTNTATVPLIGRYPGDIYDGNQFKGGNPWPLTTNALAQFYYALAKVYQRTGQITVTSISLPFFQQIDPSINKEMTINAAQDSVKFESVISHLVAAGDQAIALVKSYAVCYEDQTCMHWAEQIDRNTGAQVSAKDLTWGYTTAIAAMRERAAIS